MATITQQPKVDVVATFTLNEAEMAALHCLTSYGTKQFLEQFYKYMGRSYLEPYEKGLESLFEAVRRDVPPILDRAAAARNAFKYVPKPATQGGDNA